MSKLKEVATTIFSANSVLCTYGLLIALVLALEVPTQYALIITLAPLIVVLIISIFLFGILQCNLSEWKTEIQKISESETNTAVLENIILPILMCLLFFYMRGKLEKAGVYTISPVQCETIVHPCGSSNERLTGSMTVWDAADLISQPSENEVYIITNAAFGINQEQGDCAQKGAYCSTQDINPGQVYPKWLGNTSWAFSHKLRNGIWLPVQCPVNDDNSTTSCASGILYDNGVQTGACNETGQCNIRGWCPPISLEDFSVEPLFQDTGKFTLLLDMHLSFPEFSGLSWTSGGQNGYKANYAEIYAKYHSYQKSVIKCVYDKHDDPYCPRFLLEDIVTEAGGNYRDVASLGGQFKVEVKWNCNFDWGKDIFDCLPEYRFENRNTHRGKPKIISQVFKHEPDRRTVTYSLGISVTIQHVGKGLQIQLLNLILAAQFIFVSYKMLHQPFLLVARAVQAYVYQCCFPSILEKKKTTDTAPAPTDTAETNTSNL